MIASFDYFVAPILGRPCRANDQVFRNALSLFGLRLKLQLLVKIVSHPLLSVELLIGLNCDVISDCDVMTHE